MKKERYRLLQSTVLGTLMMLMMGMSTLAAQKEEIQLGDTTGRWRNYQEGKKYQLENGSYSSEGWLRIRGDCIISIKRVIPSAAGLWITANGILQIQTAL